MTHKGTWVNIQVPFSILDIKVNADPKNWTPQVAKGYVEQLLVLSDRLNNEDIKKKFQEMMNDCNEAINEQDTNYYKDSL